MPASINAGMLKWLRSPISILIVAHSHPDRRATSDREHAARGPVDVQIETRKYPLFIVLKQCLRLEVRHNVWALLIMS